MESEQKLSLNSKKSLNIIILVAELLFLSSCASIDKNRYKNEYVYKDDSTNLESNFEKIGTIYYEEGSFSMLNQDKPRDCYVIHFSPNGKFKENFNLKKFYKSKFILSGHNDTYKNYMSGKSKIIKFIQFSNPIDANIIISCASNGVTIVKSLRRM
jgi:hypothetical protein